MCSRPVGCVPQQQRGPAPRKLRLTFTASSPVTSGCTEDEDVFAWRQLCAEGEQKPGRDAEVVQGGGGFSAATRELFALQAFPNFPDW
jgi:hypothetical protein